MKFNLFKKVYNDNSGQVLLIVILLMSIGLGLSLGITSRITSSISRTSTLDSFQKVTAAAEAGIEIELNKTDSLILSTPLNRVHTFPVSGTKSDISVSRLTSPATGFFVFENILPGETVTYNLVDFTTVSPTSSNFSSSVANSALIRFSAPSNTPFTLSVVYFNASPATFSVASSSPTTSLVLADNNLSGRFRIENYMFNGSSWVEGSPPDNFSGNPVMLRIKALNTELPYFGVRVESAVRVSGSVVNNLFGVSVRAVPQGALITSVGRFSQAGGDPTNRTIEAFKYLDTPASFFDYGGSLDE